MIMHPVKHNAEGENKSAASGGIFITRYFIKAEKAKCKIKYMAQNYQQLKSREVIKAGNSKNTVKGRNSKEIIGIRNNLFIWKHKKTVPVI
jgi:hypothetical protein